MILAVYLDNSATTPVCDEAIECVNIAMRDCWGNPSSLHGAGIEAEKLLTDAQLKAAKLLGCAAEEIFFTSGGTESNNLALFGAANALRRRGNRIVTSAVEHPSVLQAAKQLEAQGFEVIRLGVDKGGVISTDELFDAVNEKTVLVSIMAVNNETGSVQPIDKLRTAVKRAGAPALVHVDAVQAFGKMPVNVRKLGIDLLSASSHKIHGPKGVGLLYKAKAAKITPQLFGGEQQQQLRPGTQPMPAIAGFAGAMSALPNINEQFTVTSSLRNRFLSQLSELDFVSVNSPESALPYVINISLNGMRSETLLNFLSDKEIYVSSGSACAKGHRSYVLEAMGLDPAQIDGALRVSLSRFTTEEDLNTLVSALKDARRILRR